MILSLPNKKNLGPRVLHPRAEGGFWVGTGNGGLGYLAEHGSIPLAWIVAGVLLMVSLLLFVQVEINLVRRERNHEQQASLLTSG